MNGNFVPVSDCAGIGWPALPSGGNSRILSLLYQLQQTQWWSPEELLRHQLLQLEVLVAHAYETVPFYRDRLAAVHGLGEGELTYDAWRQIPFMRREDLQDSLDQIISTSCPKEHGQILLASSSGSTGKPVTVHGTSLTQLFFMALNQRGHIWFDSDLAGKFCVLEAMVRRAERKVDTWAAGYQSGPRRAFEITRPVAEQFAWLRDEAPEYLLTYPSNLQARVDHSNERGERVPNLRRVWTMSELLDPETRNDCERHWQVPVADVYTSRELGYMAVQCPEATVYHVQSENLLLEVLNEEGDPCAAGEVGRVVLSDLKNFATPLIRYDIGDFAEVGPPCACGRGLPVLSRIMGRTRNKLRLPSGDQIWPIFGLTRLEDFPFVRQVQVIQDSLTSLSLKVVSARALRAQEESAFRDTVRNAVGHPFDVTVSYVDDVPRSASGKFEDFICAIDAP